MAVLFTELDRATEAVSLSAMHNMGLRRVRRFNVLSDFMGSGIWLMDAPPAFNIASLEHIQGLIYAEPDEEHIYSSLLWRDVRPFGTDTMTLPEVTGESGALRSALPTILDIMQVSQVHRLGIRGKGTLILVVDSGVNGNRIPDSVKAGGWSDDPISNDPWTDEMGHGTMVAMIAHAVAPEAGIFSIKLRAGPNGGLMKLSVLDALDDLLPALAGQQVIMNNSWGTPGCAAQGQPYWCNMIPTRIVWKLVNHNLATVVFAAGNSNKDCSAGAGGETSPSILCINSTPGAVTTAALDKDGLPLYYSSRGPGQCSLLHPFIAAPTFGTLPYGQGWIDTRGQGAGTSSTAPMIAGICALLRSAYPRIDNVHLMHILAISAKMTIEYETSIFTAGGDRVPFSYTTGFGMVQAMDALRSVSSPRTSPHHHIVQEFVSQRPNIGTLPTLVH